MRPHRDTEVASLPHGGEATPKSAREALLQSKCSASPPALPLVLNRPSLSFRALLHPVHAPRPPDREPANHLPQQTRCAGRENGSCRLHACAPPAPSDSKPGSPRSSTPSFRLAPSDLAPPRHRARQVGPTPAESEDVDLLAVRKRDQLAPAEREPNASSACAKSAIRKARERQSTACCPRRSPGRELPSLRVRTSTHTPGSDRCFPGRVASRRLPTFLPRGQVDGGNLLFP